MTLITNIDGIDREMTETEKTEYLKWQAEKQAKIAQNTQAETNKQSLKQATLSKLGLTADEVAALLS